MLQIFRAAGACVLLLMLLASCASIVSKSVYPVTITTNPQNVNIKITDAIGSVVYEGLTPTTIPLKASSGYFKPAFYEVILSMEGHKPHVFVIEGEIDGWYFGNFGFGGPLGFFVVDPLTGAMWKIPAQYYNFTLAPDDEVSTKSLKIINLDQVPEHLRDKLIPLKEANTN